MIYQVVGFSLDESTRFRRDYVKPIFTTNELKSMVLLDAEVFILIKSNCKIIYEKYATLYIMFVVDLEENEIFILDIMRQFLYLLDAYFKKVSDNHLISHFDVVHELLDEFILNGKVIGNNTGDIINNLK